MSKTGSFKVQIRRGFSDRNGIKPSNTKMQLDQLDEHSRISLFNTIVALYNDAFHNISSAAVTAGGTASTFWTRVLNEVYGKSVSYSKSRGFDEDKMLKIVGNTVLQDDYDDVLSFVEYLAELFKEKDRFLGFLHPYETFNTIFEREYVGYRFIRGHIVQITDENEIREIEEAAETSIDKAKEHITMAIGLLSDREAPDYGSSIRESLGAVRAICAGIAGEKASLTDALEALNEQGFGIHPSLRSVFEQLFAYSADAEKSPEDRAGGQKATFEEAKFTLVTCSAFINYLKVILSRKDGV